MNINGTPRQACSALVDKLPDPIILEPFKKFPVVRDLVVDRQSMFENLKRVKAWVPIDGTYDLGEGPRMAEEVRIALCRCLPEVLAAATGRVPAGSHCSDERARVEGFCREWL